MSQSTRPMRSGPALFGAEAPIAIQKTVLVVPPLPKTAVGAEPIDTTETAAPAPQTAPEMPAEAAAEEAAQEELHEEAEFPSVPDLAIDPLGDVVEQLEQAAAQADVFLRTCFDLALERARREAALVHAQHTELIEELRRLRKRGAELEAGNDRVRKMLRQ